MLPRPPIPGIPGVRPVMPPIIRPIIPSVTPAEKPQTTVYVGKIAPTVENDFMLSVLQVGQLMYNIRSFCTYLRTLGSFPLFLLYVYAVFEAFHS